jgi:hypothetical protein
MASQTLFEQVIDETNLRNAWIKARYYASTSIGYFDKYAYDGFEENLEANLVALRHKLMGQEYRFSPLRVFEIPKGDKTRKLYFATPKDSVVIQAIINVIGPIFERDFSELSFGNRLSPRESESKDPFRDWHEQYNQYITQALAILVEPTGTWYQISDIVNFYPSVNLTILKGLIAAKLDDAQILTLIDQLLSVRAVNLDEELEAVPGLPPGTFHAHFFANVYLDGFDKFMESRTLKYARYVDDSCFACASKQELLELETELVRFLKDQLGGLGLNEDKTEQHPMSNWQPLVEHTRKLKYDLRFGVMETIDKVATAKNALELDKARKSAETLFRDFFLTVEKEEDISRIARESAGFIATRLQSLFASEEQAINIAYGLLEANPPRTSAIRALLGCLMELSLSRPPKRLTDFIRTAPDITKITFLQLLLGFTDVHEDVIELLVHDLGRDDNYLVRANVYLALKTLDYPLDLATLRSHKESEESDYVLACLADCLSLVPDKPHQPIWPELRALLSRESNIILSAALRVLDELLSTGKLASDSLQLVFPFVQQHPSLDAFNTILVLRLVCRYGTYGMLKASFQELERHGDELSLKLARIISSKTIRFFIQRQELNSLFRFSDSLAKLGLIPEALIGYQELVAKSTDPELQELARDSRDRLGYSWHLPGLPQWYKWDGCDEGLFCELADEPDYTCRYFEDQVNNRKGTLEIVTLARVQSASDFPTADSWLNYLRYLDEAGVISLLDCGILPGGALLRVFAIYEIPPGFLPLQEWQAQDLFPADEGAVLGIASKTVLGLEKTRLATGFQFQNVNPCNVLWNPVGEIRFINIGSGLGTPKYVCGISGCRVPTYQDELGPTTGSYFIGLLLLQLLSKNCALETVARVSSRYGNRPSIAESLKELKLTPHFRCVLLRMLQRRPDYRYPSLAVLAEDVAHILRFRAYHDNLVVQWRKEQREDVLAKLTLVDYVVFRLNVIRRNPRLSNLSPVLRMSHILERLSEDLHLYDPEGLLTWRTSTGWWKSRDKLPGFLTWRWLSPEGRRLMGIARGWLALLQEVEQSCQVHYGDRLSLLLLARAIYVELLAATQGIFTANRGRTGLVQKCRSLVSELREIPPQEFVQLRLRQHHDTVSDPIANPYTHEHLIEVLEILQAALEREWPHFVIRVSSLTGLFAVLALFGFEYEFVDREERPVASSLPILTLGRSRRLKSDLWMTTKLPSVIETELGLLTNPQQPIGRFVQDWWQMTREILQFLHNLNPCQRIRGKLIWYQALASPREGKVLLGWMRLPWGIPQRDFSELVVFTSGDLIISTGLERAVEIDVWRADAGLRVSSILARSKLFTSLDPPFSTMISAARVARWMRKRRKGIVRIVIFGIAVVLYILTEQPGGHSIEKLIPIGSLAQFLRLSLWMLSAMIGNALWDVVKEYLSVSSPEDSRVVESAS